MKTKYRKYTKEYMNYLHFIHKRKWNPLKLKEHLFYGNWKKQ